MIAARGERAGTQVVKEANERAEREERLILELEKRKLDQEAAKAVAQAERRARMQAEDDVSRRKQMELKAQLAHQQAREEQEYVATVYSPENL
jgi:hypothetical protein